MNNKNIFKIPKEKTPCVYAIINAYDMKIYIGSTKNAHKRALQHSFELKSGKHGNKELQEDINKGLKFSILYELKECEIEHIKVLEKLYMFQSLEKGFKLYNKLGFTDKGKLEKDIAYDFCISYKTSENFEKVFRKTFNANSWHLKNVIYRNKLL